MRYSYVGFLMILTTLFLSGCGAGEGKMASLDERGASYYGRNGTMTGGTGSSMNNRISYTPYTQQAVPVDTISSVESRDLMAPGKSSSAGNTVKTSHGKGGSPFMTVAESNAKFEQQMQAANAANTSPAAAPAASGSWQWPVEGKVIQNFGAKGNGTSSEGITIAAAEGDPIRAAQSGTVAYIGNNMRDYGNIAILRHGDGTLTAYSHARSFTVAKGTKVNGGDVIGFVGKSGSAKAPQLHFAVREGDKAVDPIGKLPHTVASN